MSFSFTVIIPTIGRREMLARAVESVLGQTIQDFEVLVVADGVRLSSPMVDDRVRMIELPVAGGPAAARNAGIRAARGEAILFLDDDDFFLPNRLRIARRGLREAPIAICEPTGKSLRRWRDSDRGSSTRWLAGDIGSGRVPVQVGCVSVAKGIVPPFNEAYLACEDWDWWLRLVQLSPVSVQFEPGWSYGWHEGPRDLHGVDARVEFSWRLLADHGDYFETHRRARAFRLRRIGLMELQRGRSRAAAAAFRKSFKAWPSARGAYHFARAMART